MIKNLFVKDLLYRLYKNKFLYTILISLIINIIIESCLSSFTIIISNKIYVIVFNVFDISVYYVILLLYFDNITFKIQYMIINEYLNLYDKLDHKSRNNFDMQNFIIKLKNYLQNVYKFIIDEIYTIIKLIININTCIIIFINMNKIQYIIIIIVLTLIFIFILFPIVRSLSKKYKIYNKKEKDYNTKFNINIQKLVMKKIDVDTVLIPYYNDMIEKYKINFIRNNITLIVLIFNKILLITLILLIDDILIALLISNITQFVNNIKNIINITNRFCNSDIDYQSLNELFDGMKEGKKLNQLKWGNTIVIKDIFTKKTSFNQQKIFIEEGMNILVSGKSAEGKTLFLNALIGKIDGVTLEYGEPANFIDDTTEQPQNLLKYIKIEKNSLRDICNNCEDKIIIDCLKIVDLDIDHIIDKTNKNNLEIQNKFDKILRNDLCGGEEMRILACVTLSEAIKNKSKVIIFDEFERALDIDTANKITSNVIKYFNKQIIFWITHHKLNPDFYNLVLEFVDGTINIKYNKSISVK